MAGMGRGWGGDRVALDGGGIERIPTRRHHHMP
jgi:hypothetical protein